MTNPKAVTLPHELVVTNPLICLLSLIEPASNHINAVVSQQIFSAQCPHCCGDWYHLFWQWWWPSFTITTQSYAFEHVCPCKLLLVLDAVHWFAIVFFSKESVHVVIAYLVAEFWAVSVSGIRVCIFFACLRRTCAVVHTREHLIDSFTWKSCFNVMYVRLHIERLHTC